MKKLLLSACFAVVTFYANNSEAMYSLEDESKASFVNACRSINGRCVMTTRSGYGYCGITSYCKHLHIEYWEKENQLTQEMKERLCVLPDSIECLRDLRVLGVYGNNQKISLKALPNSIGNLKNLMSLDLPGNQLKNLPESIGNLMNLQVLDLSQNQITTLPESIGNLKNLRLLNLSQNQITVLPKFIEDLKQLEELKLSQNYLLKKLPEFIGNLKNLEILTLDETDLDSLPESLENLTNLERLDFSKSEIAVYSKSDGRQVSCRIKEDYPWKWHDDFVKRSFKHWSCAAFYTDSWNDIVCLDLSNRKLKQIPLGVYMMRRLEELDVSSNLLTKISPLLKKLKRLRLLSMHNNPHLKRIPDFLNEMPYLEEVRLDEELVIEEDVEPYTGSI